VTLLVDPLSLQYLMGAEVDYTEPDRCPVRDPQPERQDHLRLRRRLQHVAGMCQPGLACAVDPRHAWMPLHATNGRLRTAPTLPPASIGGTLAGCPILLRRFPVSPSLANRWSTPMPCAKMPMHWRACGQARAFSCSIRTAAPSPAMTISHWR
jgi:hypothetical protein